jgi:hypothetical protein
MIKQLVFVVDGLILVIRKPDIEKNEATKQDKQLVVDKKHFLILNLINFRYCIFYLFI